MFLYCILKTYSRAIETIQSLYSKILSPIKNAKVSEHTADIHSIRMINLDTKMAYTIYKQTFVEKLLYISCPNIVFSALWAVASSKDMHVNLPLSENIPTIVYEVIYYDMYGKRLALLSSDGIREYIDTQRMCENEEVDDGCTYILIEKLRRRLWVARCTKQAPLYANYGSFVITDMVTRMLAGFDTRVQRVPVSSEDMASYLQYIHYIPSDMPAGSKKLTYIDSKTVEEITFGEKDRVFF